MQNKYNFNGHYYEERIKTYLWVLWTRICILKPSILQKIIYPDQHELVLSYPGEHEFKKITPRNKIYTREHELTVTWVLYL